MPLIETHITFDFISPEPLRLRATPPALLLIIMPRRHYAAAFSRQPLLTLRFSYATTPDFAASLMPRAR